MRDTPKFMNVLNLEARNAMDTRRMDLANAFGARSNGLIKSASTSTCCASENVLFKTAHRKYLLHEHVHLDATTDEKEEEILKLSPVSSLSVLSQAVAIARNASPENGAAKTLKFLFRLNHLKHFSDCNLDHIGLPTNLAPNHHHKVTSADDQIPKPSAKEGENKSPEFNTHRTLDSVLTGGDGSGSIINFTAVNDIKKESCTRVDGIGMSSREELETGKANEGNVEKRVTNSSEYTERQRKNSVYEASTSHIEKEVREETPTVVACADQANQEQKMSPSKTDENKESECATKKDAEEKQQETRFRRSSSLKMPKENNSTPAQKKIVRFADALGLDLADVRTFLDELPSVPKSAYSDLKNDEPIEKLFSHSSLAMSESKTLVPMFKQPHTSFNFLDRVRDNFVSLEYAKVCPTPVCSITGTVRVRNLDFCKSVYVRYSVNNWLTFNELQAAYVPDSCDGFSDKFAFVAYIYDVKVNQRVELAVRFHCSGSIFWDNNNGSNYVFQCLPSAPIVPSYFHCYNPMSDSCNSFY